MKLLGTILAGGLSRRMEGVEKSLIKLDGKLLIQHVCDKLQPQVTDFAINANGGSERFHFLKRPVIADPIEGFVGPLAGVLAGMQWAANTSTGATHIVSVAADTPFFPDDLVERFQSALSGAPAETIALASTGQRSHPVFGLWPVMLAASLEQFLIKGETRKVLAFVDQHGLVDVPFDDKDLPHDPFFNINTAEDLAKAEDLLRGEAA